MKSKYITADEFKEYTGIDLALELKDDDNQSNKVNAFLFRVETRIEAWLETNYFHNIEREYPEFSDNQKKHYKIALIEQALYVLKNNEISEDSGLSETGVIVNRATINQLAISLNAKQQLQLAGLTNLAVYGKRWGRK